MDVPLGDAGSPSAAVKRLALGQMGGGRGQENEGLDEDLLGGASRALRSR